MKRLLLALAIVGLLAPAAQADTRFHMSISITTRTPQTVRVFYRARCVDDGASRTTRGWYRVQTPDVHHVRPPLLDADSCTLYAHVWNVGGAQVPHVVIRVTP